MHGLHNVFPPADNATEDPISDRKLKKGEAQWALVKEILGMTFNGDNKTIWLAEEKQAIIIATLKKWTLLSRRHGGIPFTEFQTILAKLQHAFLTIPAGRSLLSPFYSVLAVQP